MVSSTRYVLLKPLAVGGMAELFLARSFSGDRYCETVVIKTLRKDETHPERAAAILRDEARLGGALAHPNIVGLRDADLDAARPFLALEFVFGRDLGQLVERLRAQGEVLPARHIETILADLLDALDYAYFEARVEGRPARVVHRDVSPHNVVVGFDGRTRLLDFGLARWAHARESAEATRRAGKPAYMAPEQLVGGAVDHRSDLFCAGVLAWELLTLRRLHVGSSDQEVARSVLSTRAPWPGHRRDAGCWALRAWVWASLRRRPAWRPRRSRGWVTRMVGTSPEVRAVRRQAVGAWLRELYREPFERRARFLASIRDERVRRMVADAGFELVPAGTVTGDSRARGS